MKVAAVVVTHNRLALLQRCIDALRRQFRRVDAIIIVNNASTDGTAEWLSGEGDLITITQGNLGSGGGQHAGFKRAYTGGYDYIWSMDDDGLPFTDTLERLLGAATDTRTVYQCLTVNEHAELSFSIDIETEQTYRVVHTIQELKAALGEREQVKSGGAFFNGTLFHRNVIAEAGFPNNTLFIRGDEEEYAARIRRKGISIYLVPSARFAHPSDAVPLLSNPDPSALWKKKQYVRNRYAVLVSGHGFAMGLWKYCGFGCYLLSLIRSTKALRPELWALGWEWLAGIALPFTPSYRKGRR